MTLIDHVEAFLARTGIPPAQFGRTALRDPRFVFDLRNGREPRAATKHFVVAFMAIHSRAMGLTPGRAETRAPTKAVPRHTSNIKGDT